MEIEYSLFRGDEAGKCSCALPRLWVCSGFQLRPPRQWNGLQSQTGDARSAPAGAGLYPRAGRSSEVAHLQFGPNTRETGKRFFVEKNKSNVLERGRLLEVPGNFAQHDIGTLTQRKFGNSRAYSWKGNGLQPFLRCDAERVCGGAAQRMRGRFSAKLHAGCVYHIARL